MRNPAARQKAWLAMRHLEVFTLADIEAITDSAYQRCYRYCLALEFSEHLIRLERGGRQGYGRLRLIKDTGPVAPFVQEVKVDGQLTRVVIDPNLPNKLAQDRQRLWQAMRIKSAFTTADLVTLCGVDRSPTLRYLRALEDGGYLRELGKQRSSLVGYTGGHAKVLQLIKNTGPIAPVPESGGLFDANEFSVQQFFEEIRNHA